MNATELAALVKREIDSVIAYYKELAIDGLTTAEIWELVMRATASLMQVVGAVAGASPEDRKEVVLQALAKFYDEVLAPLDIPYIPDFLERTIVDEALKKIMLTLASGTIDALLKLFNRTGVPVLPPAPPGTPGAPPFQPY